MVLVVVLLSVAGILGSVGVTVGVEILHQFEKFKKLKPPAILWMVSTVCSDAIITTTLVMHLVSVVVDLPRSCVNIVNIEEREEWIP